MAIDMTRWEEAVEKVRQLKDSNGASVDEGIVETVAVMALFGFTTTMSCWGHEDRDTGGPYVMFRSSKAKELEGDWQAIDDKSTPEAKRLWSLADDEGCRERYKVHELLVEFYQSHPLNYDSMLTLRSIGAATTWIGVASNRYGELFGGEQQQSRLDESRQEMERFTEFLKDKIEINEET